MLAALMVAAVAVGMIVDESPVNGEPVGSVVVVMMAVAYSAPTVLRGRSKTHWLFASVSRCLRLGQYRERRLDRVRSRCSLRSVVDALVGKEVRFEGRHLASMVLGSWAAETSHARSMERQHSARTDAEDVEGPWSDSRAVV